MEPRTLVVIEMFVFFGGALAFAVWQVIATRRSLERDRAKSE
jgi:hypothetical protein